MVSQVLTEDIKQIISDTNIPWEETNNSTFFITGATGIIGGMLVHALSAANKKYGLNLRIIAHGRNALKGDAVSQAYGAEFISGDIREPFSVSSVADKIDYIFHCAAMTKSADMIAKPVDIITTSIDGTRNVLELAREMQSKSVMYISSMEVYGLTAIKDVCESDLGYLNLSNPRSSYPESKRLCENLCAAYWAEYGIPVKIARLARTIGAGIPNDDTDMRVANQFARKVVAGDDIELHTLGNSIANCCYTSDVIRGLFTILLKGESGETYNVANPDASATVREMAEVVARDVCGGRIKVVIAVPEDIEKRGYASDIGFRLNADKLKELGWTPRFSLKDMYTNMIADWRKEDVL